MRKKWKRKSSNRVLAAGGAIVLVLGVLLVIGLVVGKESKVKSPLNAERSALDYGGVEREGMEEEAVVSKYPNCGEKTP